MHFAGIYMVQLKGPACIFTKWCRESVAPRSPQRWELKKPRRRLLRTAWHASHCNLACTNNEIKRRKWKELSWNKRLSVLLLSAAGEAPGEQRNCTLSRTARGGDGEFSPWMSDEISLRCVQSAASRLGLLSALYLLVRPYQQQQR